MMKPRYFVKALALYKVFRTYQLSRKDLDKADSLSANLKAQGQDFKLLVGMAKDTLTGKYKMNKWNMSIIVGTVVYVISPLDAVPDIIPVLGWLDDVAIVSYALTKLQKEIERYKAEQQLQPEKI
ncbi:YkvA family protein [Sphingobacterium sp. lm-10]|uniref:YkvA family protein n=1 Tax=Sphingobacterium sp. lm-10 TaxID=2944904 RepID=UPI0020209AB8|nr:YkvA family protein [Sphingobacterium sp. lm-10]MCL7986904.1 YkvA family protein [Sphingobacterium sp. lm-10]